MQKAELWRLFTNLTEKQRKLRPAIQGLFYSICSGSKTVTIIKIEALHAILWQLPDQEVIFKDFSCTSPAAVNSCDHPRQCENILTSPSKWLTISTNTQTNQPTMHAWHVKLPLFSAKVTYQLGKDNSIFVVLDVFQVFIYMKILLILLSVQYCTINQDIW